MSITTFRVAYFAKLYQRPLKRYRRCMISFTKCPDGIYRAHIGAIEVELEEHGYLMHLWEMVSHLPCGFGPCLDEKCWPEWQQTDDCPHEYWEEGVTHSITAMGCRDRREAVEDAKAQLRRQQSYKRRWPVAEAARFIDEPWTHEREPPRG